MLLKDTGRVSRDLESEPKGRPAGRGAEGAGLDPEGRLANRKATARTAREASEAGPPASARARGRVPASCPSRGGALGGCETVGRRAPASSPQASSAVHFPFPSCSPGRPHPLPHLHRVLLLV